MHHLRYIAFSALLLLLAAPPANAYSHVQYYGIYQHVSDNLNLSQMYALNDGVYQRRYYRYISGLAYVIIGSNWGVPAEEDEYWRYDLSRGDTIISSITFDHSAGCLFATGDDGERRLLGCLDDPHVLWLVGTFTSSCLEEEPHAITFSHSTFTALPNNFQPTPFEPDVPKVTISPDAIQPHIPASGQNHGSLAAMPEVAAGEMILHVEVLDDTGCGRPLPDIPVSVTNTLVPGSGGHLHFDSAMELGTGKYLNATPAWSLISDDATQFSTITDEQGKVSAAYRAGLFGVEEDIAVTAVSPLDSSKRISYGNILTIGVPGLIPLDISGLTYTLEGGYTSPCDTGHNHGPTRRESHHVTPQMSTRVQEMHDRFFLETDIHLSLNDASLPLGGFFDAGDNNDRNRRCHAWHRQGVDIDVNVGGSAGCPSPYNLNCSAGVAGDDPNIPRREILDSIVREEMGGYKYPEDSLHYRFINAN